MPLLVYTLVRRIILNIQRQGKYFLLHSFYINYRNKNLTSGVQVKRAGWRIFDKITDNKNNKNLTIMDGRWFFLRLI